MFLAARRLPGLEFQSHEGAALLSDWSLIYVSRCTSRSPVIGPLHPLVICYILRFAVCWRAVPCVCMRVCACLPAIARGTSRHEPERLSITSQLAHPSQRRQRHQRVEQCMVHNETGNKMNEFHTFLSRRCRQARINRHTRTVHTWACAVWYFSTPQQNPH